ncbi:ankyrin repeat-containing domain protein [Fusarium flagelliforme]|uniref:ankyrin repeat-containing domain protein n=1 Tax=Fusarium flagelliforme TaxID=2675880 RepID=UPI001E8D159D|nr:ankyrin repeat-containing domain protein [Fusarium flagelliforme]KAH7173239.1 ankyrin repeat-containing domain protein [Fusarium flagelliforme]
MFQQAPIPDHTYWNTAGVSPKSLYSSIAVGDLTALRRFLSDKLDVSASIYGAPLHQAIYRENEEAVDILLQAGADPLKEPEIFHLEYLTTPFGLAARLNNRAILKKVWQHINPDINGYDMQGFDSCLVEAAQYGDVATLGAVLRWGQNNWSSESRSRALSAAADNWHVENLQLLLSERMPFEKEALDDALAQVTVPKLCFERRDQTQAEIAAQSQSIKVLMAAGADPRARVKRDPTWRRRREDNEPTEAVFNTLLVFNASICQQDLAGNTPLHFAAYGSPIRVLHQLLSSIPVELQKNALTMPNHNGETALHFASAGGQIDTIKYLLSDNVGLDINETASMGWTPLLRALAPTEPSLTNLSLLSKIEAAHLLLAHGADPSKSAHDGWTPLHCFAMNRTYGKSDERPRLVETLVLCGNSLNSRASFALDNPPTRRTRKHGVQEGLHWGCRESQYIESPIEWGKARRFGLTPLHIAAEFGALDTVVALLRHGADPTAEDSEGNSPARLAGYSKKYSSRSEARGTVMTTLIDAGGTY